MLQTLHEMLAPAAMERLTLLINHVLRREPAAVERLLPHAGRSLRVEPEGWPAWLPPLPALAFRVTPAGLLEWCGAESETAPDLRLRLPDADPARLALQALSGRPPEVQVEGDARFAADASWLVENLRWDIADDVERLLGPAAAQALVPVLTAARAGLARAAAAAQALAARFVPGASRGSEGFAAGPGPAR